MARRWFELLMEDHTTIEKVFAAMDKAFATESGPTRDTVRDMLDFVKSYVDGCHAKKEEEHLFPLIEARGIPSQGGPLGVMLYEHERSKTILRDMEPLALAYIRGDRAKLAPLKAAFTEYATLLGDHFWKENDILYPMAMRVMSTTDEQAVLNGIAAAEAALGPDTHEKYYALAERIAGGAGLTDLSHALDRDVLAAILNRLPVEISFVDANDQVAYFSHEDQDKIFPRNRSSIGMKVQDCHPQKSVHLVNQILADFKAGKRDVAEFWIDFKDTKVHIRYYPVLGKKGEYLGCLEVVQDVGGILGLEGQRRLLDEA